MTAREELVIELAHQLGMSEEYVRGLLLPIEEAKGRFSDWDREQAGRHIMWKRGDEGGYEPGGFITTLLLAWDRADMVNRGRLGWAFPVYSEAIMAREVSLETLRRWMAPREAKEES